MLILSKTLLDEMIEQCRREAPDEACGILAGKVSKIEKVYRMDNAEKGPATFFMDPKEQFKAMKDIRQLGLEMIGIYHSHVASQAYPSGHDVEMAFYPEASYVIISLKNMESPQVRSFKIAEGEITEEEVRIV
ncbi:MAG: M67 family metallopeptidase [Candidatus Omnitrophota bacterium]|nr:M67 family metallopeptidase [Candidatus Omnitrophota bacterium]